MQDLTGKIVFIERNLANISAACSNYLDGEYVVVRQTPNYLYCVRLKLGYEGKTVRAFLLSEYTVVNAVNNDKLVLEHANSLEAWTKESLAADKIESAYTEAIDVVRQLRSLYINTPTIDRFSRIYHFQAYLDRSRDCRISQNWEVTIENNKVIKVCEVKLGVNTND